MSRFVGLFVVLSVGCSEYQFRGDREATGPRQDDPEGADGVDGDDGDDDWNGNGDDWTPDEFGDDDCDGGVQGEWLSGEIYVLSWDHTTDSGVLYAPEEGWYHLYDRSVAESGDSQWNETAYLRVTNDVNVDGYPRYANCGDDWFVVDPDNDADLPDGTTVYMGTFYLVAGDNTVTFIHACPRIRDGECPDLHVEDDPDSTCDTGNPNSAHFTGDGLCLVAQMAG